MTVTMPETTPQHPEPAEGAFGRSAEFAPIPSDFYGFENALSDQEKVEVSGDLSAANTIDFDIPGAALECGAHPSRGLRFVQISNSEADSASKNNCARG